jgi:hypothetical protein
MSAAVRVGDRDVVAGRGDLIRRGRGREGEEVEDWSAAMLDRRTVLEFLSSGGGMDPVSAAVVASWGGAEAT